MTAIATDIAIAALEHIQAGRVAAAEKAAIQVSALRPDDPAGSVLRVAAQWSQRDVGPQDDEYRERVKLGTLPGDLPEANSQEELGRRLIATLEEHQTPLYGLAAAGAALLLNPDGFCHHTIFEEVARRTAPIAGLAAAQQILRFALERAPYLATGWQTLGCLLLRYGRCTSAYRPLVQAVALKPGHGEAMEHLAAVHYDSGRLDLAAVFYEQVQQVSLEPGLVKLRRAQCHLSLGNPLKAVSIRFASSNKLHSAATSELAQDLFEGPVAPLQSASQSTSAVITGPGVIIGEDCLPVFNGHPLDLRGNVFNPETTIGTRQTGFGNLLLSRERFAYRVDHRFGSDKPTFALGNNPNFGHWLFNHFARLHAVSIKDLGHFIVTSSIGRRQLDLLQFVGIGPEKIVKLRPGILFYARDLRVAPMPWRMEATGTWSLDPDATKFVQSLSSAFWGGAKSRRLFLTRNQATRRRLLNEDEIFPIFAEAGFEKVVPESLEIADQIRLAGEAEMIAGVIGAGMLMSSFAPAGTRILEIKAPHMTMDFYREIAQFNNQRYHPIFATPQPGQRRLHADLTVDPSLVRTALAETVSV